MKKIYLIISLLSFLFINVSCKESKTLTKDDPLTVEDFYIIRVKDNFVIKSDLHITELSKVLQKADKIDIKKDKHDPEYKTHYYYFDGLTIEGEDGPEKFCDGNLFIITNSKYKINREIKIGDTKNKVLERYGNPNTDYKFEDNLYCYAEDPSLFQGVLNGLLISFLFDSNSKIKEIRIEFRQLCF